MSFSKSLLLSVSLIAFSPLASYAGPAQFMGDAELKNQTFQEAVTSMGRLKIDKSKLAQSLTSMGDADIKDSELQDGTFNGKTEVEKSSFTGSFTSNGDTELESVSITKQTTINGNTKIKKSTFGDTVTASGEFDAEDSTFKAIIAEVEKMELSNCKAESILIKKSTDATKQQIVELKGKTDITGSITFESGNGKVVIKDKTVKTGEIKGVATSSPAAAKTTPADTKPASAENTTANPAKGQ
ncbi:MAG: hypothetical protein KBE16_01080 [Alphaproteobacteria bacterium]|nr:hypothetical protein [Alphaproteobacteria bacterium]MBP9876739.1 hypothetical protein [Alphaproteobacteria bacterium]